MKSTQIKIIKTGNYYEVFSYRYSVIYGFHTSSNYSLSDKTIQKNIDNYKKASTRARNNVARLILGNMHSHPEYRLVFLTLTFSDNITDLGVANPLFSLFMKRLNYYCNKEIKYIAVPEFQERGAVHYHMLIFNMPYIDKMIIEKDIWKHGGTTIKAVNRSKGLYNYITKYITKAFLDERCRYKKKYFSSVDYRPKIEREQDNAIAIYSYLDDKDMIDKPYTFEYKDGKGRIMQVIEKRRYLVGGVGGTLAPQTGGA